MNPLRRFFRWVLFVIHNGGRKPEYPFEDDCVEKPLELHIGPWGSTKWYDPSDGSLCEVATVDDVASIAESMERDILGRTYREAVEEERRKKADHRCLPPRVIRFLEPPYENTLQLFNIRENTG